MLKFPVVPRRVGRSPDDVTGFIAGYVAYVSPPSIFANDVLGKLTGAKETCRA